MEEPKIDHEPCLYTIVVKFQDIHRNRHSWFAIQPTYRYSYQLIDHSTYKDVGSGGYYDSPERLVAALDELLSRVCTWEQKHRPRILQNPFYIQIVNHGDYGDFGIADLGYVLANPLWHAQVLQGYYKTPNIFLPPKLKSLTDFLFSNWSCITLLDPLEVEEP